MRMENIIFRKSISFDRKIKALTQKLFYVSIFTSNHFQTQTRTQRERERERVFDFAQPNRPARSHPNPWYVYEIAQLRSSRRDRATWSLPLLNRFRPPLGQIISSSGLISSSATRRSISSSRSISSPICFLSLISIFFFFFFCGGVGGGVLVVSMLCGGVFCVDNGGFSVGAGGFSVGADVWVVVDFVI